MHKYQVSSNFPSCKKNLQTQTKFANTKNSKNIRLTTIIKQSTMSYQISYKN